MKLPISLIDELEQRRVEGATVTSTEFRELAIRHGVDPSTIAQIVGRSPEVEAQLGKFKQTQSLADLKALCELMPGSAEDFEAIAERLTRGLQPDPSAALH